MATLNVKGKSARKIILCSLSVLAALCTYISLFLPVVRHQSTTHPEMDLGEGDFGVVDVSTGGLYNKNNDTPIYDAEGNSALPGYEKLSDKAKVYYTQVCLLAPSTDTSGRTSATFLFLTECFAVILVLAALLGILSGQDTYLAQVIFGVVQVVLSILTLVFLGKLTDAVSVTEFGGKVDFEIVVRSAPYVLIAAAVFYTVVSLVGLLTEIVSKAKKRG